MVFRNCACKCDTYFDVEPSKEQYHLSCFVFENLNIEAKKDGFSEEAIENVTVNHVKIKTE